MNGLHPSIIIHEEWCKTLCITSALKYMYLNVSYLLCWNWSDEGTCTKYPFFMALIQFDPCQSSFIYDSAYTRWQYPLSANAKQLQQHFVFFPGDSLSSSRHFGWTRPYQHLMEIRTSLHLICFSGSHAAVLSKGSQRHKLRTFKGSSLIHKSEVFSCWERAHPTSFDACQH